MHQIHLNTLYGQLFNLAIAPRMSTEVVVNVEEADVDNLVQEDTDFIFDCQLGDFTFPVPPLIRVKGGNTIVKTKVAKVKGTVKEFIQEDDSKITIRGILINEDSNDLPLDLIRQLRTELKRQEVLELKNRLTLAHGITHVSVDDWDFPEDEGYQNSQTFIIHCSSDFLPELILK